MSRPDSRATRVSSGRFMVKHQGTQRLSTQRNTNTRRQRFAILLRDQCYKNKTIGRDEGTARESATYCRSTYPGRGLWLTLHAGTHPPCLYRGRKCGLSHLDEADIIMACVPRMSDTVEIVRLLHVSRQGHRGNLHAIPSTWPIRLANVVPT